MLHEEIQFPWFACIAASFSGQVLGLGLAVQGVMVCTFKISYAF
jgi:hypothetical protein